MDIAWNFPGNGNGQIRGYSDAGIETFNGNELQSLARETCQNSLDARVDEEKQVIIEFERNTLKSENIPGCVEYRNVISKCKAYWELQNTEKAHRFLKEANRQVLSNTMFVLRISDYNTKGLADPYGCSVEGWNSLTKVDGGSTKNGDAAGSFGVGKNAPFSNSYYRLVFYRTLNLAGERAAQGMSRLLSYPSDASNPMESMTVGIGYYGNKDKNTPIPKIDELDKINIRNDIGTDVFIFGFKGTKDWESEMIIDILENFLLSIYRRKLEVKVQNTKINDKTLGAIVSRYETKAKNAYCDYRVLNETGTDAVKEFQMNFHGLGVLKLRVLIDPLKKLNRKILVVRNSGMMLFQLAGVSRVLSFSGILELEGVKLNEYFREMENMAHNKWEPKIHSNPKEAKAYYDELKDWVRKTVMDLGENSSEDEVDVEGLSDILQDSSKVKENPESEKNRENLNNNLGKIEINERPKINKKGKFYPLGDEEHDSGGVNNVKGTVEEGGKIPATRTLKGTRQRKTSQTHVGTVEPDGKDILHKNSGINTPCDLKNVRIMKLGNSKFRMIFEVPYNVREGHIEVCTVGENSRSVKLKVTSAEINAACLYAHVNSGLIEFKDMAGKEKVKIDFTLHDSREFAMEVNVYEHN